MNVERVKKLLEVLKRVRDEQRPFNIMLWRNDSAVFKLCPETGCGTQCCAAGWYVLLAKPEDLELSELSLRWYTVKHTRKKMYGEPLMMYEALQEHFGYGVDWYAVFNPECYGSSSVVCVEEVIGRVEKILEAQEAVIQ